LVFFVLGHFQHVGQVGNVLVQLGPGLKAIAQPFDLEHQLFGGIALVPKSGLAAAFFQLVDFLF